MGLALKAAPYVAIGTLGLLCWHLDSRAVANADLVRTQAAQFKAAQIASEAAWSAKLAAQTQTYTQQKKDAQNEYNASLVNNRSYTDRYIAAGGMRATNNQSAASTPAKPTETPIAGLREEVPTDSVMVSASDVQGCAVTTGYALALRDWAIAVTK